ncbi:MAG: 3-hydroxyacyl-CoA dehydrogenase [Hyphomicrobiaceae bacterium]|nr:MAG: 3-hydroxyacyl-CoA dehydrogenase [Hyphomicrobiaceae bacterium]
MGEQPMPLRDWHYCVDMEGIAWCVFDREGESTNALGRRPFEELNEIVNRLEAGASSGAIKGAAFLSAKDSGFIAGADVREFEKFTTEAEVREAVEQGLYVFNRIEKLKIPTVAGVHGFCLGGGLELVLAMSWRIAVRDESTRFGFPEVKLGLFPGLNGTVRSIKYAGPVAALNLMLKGNMVRASAAKAIGLVNELVASRQNLKWAARKAILRKRQAEPAGAMQTLMRQWPARGYIAQKARAATAEKAREEHYPAPFRLIDLFEKHGGDLEAMAKAETAAFVPLMVSDTSQNLRRVFRLSEAMKAQVPKSGFKPLRVHVIGAGTMGADIAAACVLAGLEASIQDLDAEQITAALARGRKLFDRRLKGRAQRDAAIARLIGDCNGEHIARADVVIEAIVEKLEVKQGLFKDLETRLKPGAVMATNTSSIMIERIAEPLADPGRLIGLHFFNPVPAVPLVEVVRGAQSREEEVKKGCAFVTAINKFPLIVKSCPGFLVNRVLVPYMMESMARLEKGTRKETIDAAAVAFGMPVGPIELADQVGLDICKHVAEIIKGRDAVPPDSQLARLVAEKKLGKKTGAGFYEWKEGEAVRQPTTADSEELKRLGAELIEPLVKECERALEDHVVESADMVDAGVIFGSGFAPFRGGPLNYARSRAVEPARTAAE